MGKEVSRVLTVNNDSDLPTKYEFYSEHGNIFSFSKNKGVVNGNSSSRIIVTFIPKNTMCYYERVFCIVRNHSLLYVDFIGLCYDLLIKPLSITQKHVDSFRRRVVEG